MKGQPRMMRIMSGRISYFLGSTDETSRSVRTETASSPTPAPIPLATTKTIPRIRVAMGATKRRTNIQGSYFGEVEIIVCALISAGLPSDLLGQHG